MTTLLYKPKFLILATFTMILANVFVGFKYNSVKRKEDNIDNIVWQEQARQKELVRLIKILEGKAQDGYGDLRAKAEVALAEKYPGVNLVPLDAGWRSGSVTVTRVPRPVPVVDGRGEGRVGTAVASDTETLAPQPSPRR